MIRIE